MAERLDHFMRRAVAAYYARAASPFGRAGDFTTAPEISQAFGEVLGLWASVVWQRMGAPAPVLLVECGPGRGTLMADALRAAADVAAPFRQAVRVHLIEASPPLRQAQRHLLGAAVSGWHDDLAALPAGPMLLLANEFLDALPIRQFIRRGDAWRERHVEAGHFLEAAAPDPPPLPAAAPEGAVREIGEAAQRLVGGIAARLVAQGGAALFLDYGPAASGFGDSLQAVAGQQRGRDPLADPGSADLTAHVDFGALAEAARRAGAAAQGPLPQGLFLQRLGLMTRAAMLARSRPRLAAEILSGAERLVAAEGMGRLFKALAVCDPTLVSLPGFESP
jgi:SAM-dependent MidA family methyltransferase